MSTAPLETPCVEPVATLAAVEPVPLTGSRAGAKARTRRARARGAPFVAVDGEGVDIDGEHRYVLLGSSSGNYVEDLAGLSTRDCLTFLVREGQGKPRPILVGFYFNYDVNMILRDLTRDELVQLWEEQTLEWRPDDDTLFVLDWVPTKLLTIYAELGDARGHVKLYDCSGFFQQSFVRALSAWGFGDREAIAQMKDRRAVFSVDELDDIRAYCLEECRLLVEMMGRVRDALHSVDLRPRTWLGAGAIASALLARHQVDEHLQRSPVKRPALDDAVMRAYFGGRTEVFRQGIHPVAESWDVNSAYPWAATELPSEQGSWKRARTYDPDAPFALWRCSWEIDPAELVAPFPFRNKRAIAFPLAGDGIYHAEEVRAAIELHGDRIHVTSGYVFEPADDARPFAFLPDVYAHRQTLKAAGDPAEKVLKLGINSVYGKLAQGNSRRGFRPKFQSYFWAGQITAQTRARMLRAAAIAPELVVAIATDGIVFAPGLPRRGSLTIAPGLGGWERTRYRDFFVAQPGMYHAIERATNTHVKHSRGFFTKEIDFPKLRRLWLERGPVATLACRSTRFVGLGSALVRSDFTVWRKWVDGERRVSLYLSPRKRYADEEPEQSKQLRPPYRIRAGLSDVYVPKRAVVELDPDAEEWIQGVEQPGRVF